MNQLLIKVEKHVSSLLRSELSNIFIYHNLSHTQRVVKFCKDVVAVENISKFDAENLIISAWFHDIGYIKSTDNHEEESVKIASYFLKKQDLDTERINAITNIIMATKMGYNPKNLLEQIIRDADCAHFGDKTFIELSELLRHEWQQTSNKIYSDSEWTNENISFLK